MTYQEPAADRASRIISATGAVLLRIGLVVPLAWIGVQKFTAEEAAGIMPLIEHQPLMSWLYDVVSAQTLSNALGTVEIVAAILIAAKAVSATASAIGSFVAALLFLSTISFLLTTPDVVASSSLHIPLLTDTGGFLIKDIALLGAAIWTLGDALRSRTGAHHRNVAPLAATLAGDAVSPSMGLGHGRG